MPTITPERLAKLKWQCRRGMLELDLLLEPFAKNVLPSMKDEEVVVFERFLQFSDPEIYSWLMGHDVPPEEVASLVKFIQMHPYSR